MPATDPSKAEFLTFGFRTPPNTVPLAPEMADRIHELHRLVRAWVQGPRLPADPRFDTTPTLLYVDLLFAFALAKVGAPDAAHTLMDTARRELAAEPPVGQLPALRGLLFRCYETRIADALANKPLAGPLPPELFADIAALVKSHPEDRSDPEKPFPTEYIFSRLWNCSRVLDPDADHDPYSPHIKYAIDLENRLTDMAGKFTPAAMAATVFDLCRAESRKSPAENQSLKLISRALVSAARLGEEFTIALLVSIPRVIAATPPTFPDAYLWSSEVLGRSLRIAALSGTPETVRVLTAEFVTLARTQEVEYRRLRVIGEVLPQAVRSLETSGLRDDITHLIEQLTASVLGQTTVSERLASHKKGTDEFRVLLQFILPLLGTTHANVVPSHARDTLAASFELLTGRGTTTALTFTNLTKAYLAALESTVANEGLPQVVDLFTKMDPNRVSNTFTTKRYYSRLHLEVVEAAALSLVRMFLGRV